jgi:hypothetical protein
VNFSNVIITCKRITICAICCAIMQLLCKYFFYFCASDRNILVNYELVSYIANDSIICARLCCFNESVTPVLQLICTFFVIRNFFWFLTNLFISCGKISHSVKQIHNFLEICLTECDIFPQEINKFVKNQKKLRITKNVQINCNTGVTDSLKQHSRAQIMESFAI